MIRTTITFALILTATGAQAEKAEVYTCTTASGSKVFSDTPCGNKAEKIRIEAQPSIVEKLTNDLVAKETAKREKEKAEREREQAKRRDAIQRREREDRFDRQNAAAQIQDPHTQSLIVNQRIEIGMKAEHVKISWGRPDKINRDTYQSGTVEQWIYEKSDFDNDYVYVENGVVTAIQE